MHPSIHSPVEALDHAIEIYRTTVHLQPLPLLRPAELSNYLASSPRFLLYSFLSLALSFKASTIYGDQQCDAVKYYTRSAQNTVRELASQGVSTLEVVQSLCLLALRDILGNGPCTIPGSHTLIVMWLECKPFQAQVTIGTASRLENCRRLANPPGSDISVDQDLSLRCRWSVFILEKIFCPQLCASNDDIQGLGFPSSAPVPPLLPSARREDCPSDLYNGYDAKNDFGITAYYMKMASLSGNVASWLHHMRMAKYEAPWMPESTYAKLVAKIYVCDSQLPASHLLRNVAFSKRSLEEVLGQREYWTPWVLMQVECHACLAILNHPFIHLVAVRSCSAGPPSSMFLQRTVDAAMFHSRWVFHFLRLCDANRLELSDPLVGHLVAAVATIPWLLQFVEDVQISQEATQNLSWCRKYLDRVSIVWPHMLQKVRMAHNYILKDDKYMTANCN